MGSKKFSPVKKIQGKTGKKKKGKKGGKIKGKNGREFIESLKTFIVAQAFTA